MVLDSQKWGGGKTWNEGQTWTGAVADSLVQSTPRATRMPSMSVFNAGINNTYSFFIVRLMFAKLCHLCHVSCLCYVLLSFASVYNVLNSFFDGQYRQHMTPVLHFKVTHNSSCLSDITGANLTEFLLLHLELWKGYKYFFGYAVVLPETNVYYWWSTPLNQCSAIINILIWTVDPTSTCRWEGSYILTNLKRISL